MIPVDQSARTKAVQDLSRSLVVEAGAGTGKTTLLATRYVELLSTHKLKPTQIVAITFTEKAALELKERIRTILLKEGQQEILNDLDRAPISTIHSFAASLLRERPIEAHLDPNFEILDAIGTELLFDETYERWFPEALQAHRNAFSRAFAAGIRISRIREIAYELYRHRDLLDYLQLSPSDISFHDPYHEVVRRANELYTYAKTHCANTSDKGFVGIEALHQEVQHSLKLSEELKERALLLRFEISSQGNQSNWSSKETAAEQKQKSKELREILEQLQREIRTSIFSGLLKVLVEFVASIEKRKEAKGVLDFDDLLLKSRDLLTNNIDVLTYFQERYSTFLVDEFQDTDPIQTELTWLLTSEPTNKPWRERRLKPGSLFVVGDPKQSIYRFRRANIAIYDEATTHIEAVGERLFIHQNFRSNAELIQWINQTFSAVLKDRFHPLSSNPNHSLPPTQRPVWLLPPPNESGLETTRDLRKLEAETVAALIHTILKNSSLQIFSKEEGRWRNPTLSDFAILFPTTTDVDLFEAELRRYDLPFSLEGGKLFFERAEVHALLSILDAIEHPTDEIAVVSALRSSLMGLSDVEILTLSQQTHRFDYRKEGSSSLSPATKEAFLFLRSFHERRLTLCPSRLMELILSEMTLVPQVLGRRHGEQAAANIFKLVELARTLEKRGSITLAQWIRWIRQRANGNEAQNESDTFDEAEDRIRLLTVHKAKGLEFPIVILANISSATDRHEMVVADRLKERLSLGIGSKEKRFSTLDYEERGEEEKLERHEERKRLLYVAATRAKDLLILPRFRSARRASELWKILDEGFISDSPLVYSVDVERLAFMSEESTAHERNVASSYERTFRDLHTEKNETFNLRRSSWKQGLPMKTASGAANKDAVHPTNVQPSRGFQEGARVGTAVHTLFQHLDYTQAEISLQTVGHICKTLRVTEEPAEIKRWIDQSLQSPFFAKIRNSKRLFRELPLSLWNSGILMEGVVDLLFEDEGTFALVDFKTDRVRHDSEFQVEKYRPQLHFYVDILSKQLKVPIRSYLFFVRYQKCIEC